MSEVGVGIGAPGNQRRGALCVPQFESLLVQAPHQRLAHAGHAQHTEAPAFQLVQDYPRGVVDVVLLAVNGRRGQCERLNGDEGRTYWCLTGWLVSPGLSARAWAPPLPSTSCALSHLFLSTT